MDNRLLRSKYLDNLRYFCDLESYDEAVKDSFIFMADTYCVKVWIDWSVIDPSLYPSDFGQSFLLLDERTNNLLTHHAKCIHRGLLYEANVYKLITEKFKDSDNFIHFIDHFSLNLSMVPEYIQKIINTSRVPAFELSAYFIITTTHPKLQTLEKFGVRNIPEDEISKVIFQLMYTIYQINNIGIIHRDLHDENILIYKSENKIVRRYYVCGKEFEFETNYIPKIFDWNISTVESLGTNLFAHFDCADENGEGVYLNTDAWNVAYQFFKSQRFDDITLIVKDYGLNFSEYHSLDFEYYFNHCKI